MNKPVQVITAFGIMLFSLYSCGGKEAVDIPANNDTDKAISLKIENGTGLTYKVTPTELVNYSLDITFRELSPKLSFDFVMTNMDYTKGSVQMEENACKTAHTVTGQFQNGKSVYADRTCMVLSLEVYRDLLEASKSKITIDGEEVEFMVLNNEDYKFEKGNGHVTETVMHCANADKSRQIWVWKNPQLPLIMKITGNPTMELTYWYLPGERP